MKLNRKSVTWGLAGVALAGALVGGAGVAVAAYLGLSRTVLQAQLHRGKALADVAAAQGKSVSGLEDAMVAAMTTNLDANTTLTAEEKAADVALMRSHLDVMVSATHSSGAGFEPMGAGMGGMEMLTPLRSGSFGQRSAAPDR